MSGPVTAADISSDVDAVPAPAAVVEVTESRTSQVGTFSVRRALPRRTRRTVGDWCFVDHMGPATVDERGLGVAPHPHIGLQTVAWLVAGEAVHRDSLGTEQVIVPGELNLMTAGHGVSHSEEGTGRSHGEIHGVQLWVAQPATTRDGPPAFDHHGTLPSVELDQAVAIVLVGELSGALSPARRDTDHVGVDLELRSGTTTLPLRADYEHALVILTGAARVDGVHVTPGHLAYLGERRDELAITVAEPSRALLLGGVPFEEPVVMWWNFVARDRGEIDAAQRAWMTRDARFGEVASALPRIEVGPPLWSEP